MDCEKIKGRIVEWLKNKVNEAKVESLVVNISGGVDSALVGALCCETGIPVYLVGQPCYNTEKSNNNMRRMLNWFSELYSGNAIVSIINMSDISTDYEQAFKYDGIKGLTIANMRSRIRMIMVYMFANEYNGLVVGTGNYIEDFVLGFFTKYGDGGVDISPIGDLTKSEVRELAEYMKVPMDIIKAKPTDGLWGDERGDEDILGITYEEAEWLMKQNGAKSLFMHDSFETFVNIMKKADSYDGSGNYWDLYTDRQKVIIETVWKWHSKTKHKMTMPEICELKGIK